MQSKITLSLFIVLFTAQNRLMAQSFPKILTDKSVKEQQYLPDFSYAGYHFGEEEPNTENWKVIKAADYGVIADDGRDDSQALLKAIAATKSIDEPVILQLPSGRIILSEVFYIERSQFVLRGSGSGVNGTELFFPRPLMYLKDPESLTELREYLLKFDKRQREKENNIDLPFSQYAWSGGFIWLRVPGERVKYYLHKYDSPATVLAAVTNGERGEHTLKVNQVKNLHVGDVVQLELFNKEGEKGKILQDLYKGTDVKVGAHHWEFPDLPIVRQQVTITAISKNKIEIKSPLTLSIKPEYKARLTVWKHLTEVGIEQLRITFPKAPKMAHHVEMGYNAIYLTRLYNGWVNDVTITNADSGILTEAVANTTIKNIVTNGENVAHYSVAMSGVYDVLVNNLKVYNPVIHPLSFNTFATKSVYQNCEVFINPDLDQHAGANHQNLFDNITVHVDPKTDHSYPLFAGGGAGYWKPSHGAYSTFWNINVHVLSGLDNKKPIVLDGMKDGPFARIIGVHGNHKLEVDYGPNPYIEWINTSLNPVPSLYDYQLQKRLQKN